MAHTSPVYIAAGDRYDPFDAEVALYMKHLIEGARLYVLERARTEWPGGASHRHGHADHRAFLLKPLDEALAVLQARRRLHSQNGSTPE